MCTARGLECRDQVELYAVEAVHMHSTARANGSTAEGDSRGNLPQRGERRQRLEEYVPWVVGVGAHYAWGRLETLPLPQRPALRLAHLRD